jgi:protein involved in polysaccharide export with SLBB domain
MMFRVLMLFVSLLIAAPSGLASQTQPAGDVVSLQPGDALRVEVWREEDLSGTFQVDSDGVVTLPLLGSRQVAGIPLRQLRDDLIREYRVQLRNPSITITPLRRVNVFGEVNKPGLYGVDPTISLAGVVALAGGATPAGDLNRIRILRGGQILRERVAADMMIDAVDIRSGDQILVQQRGWFERNSTFVVSLLLSVTSLIIGIVR